MKRKLSEVADGKTALDETHQTVATLVAQQVASLIIEPIRGSFLGRFGCVAFGDQEKQSVNTFLHQKLGKDSLSRRPGPGGRKLTYIESCKAIELANRAFGFNGWSCRIVECKEEYKERKGDRWSVGYSSLVRIELKDGTSHEDVGFGSSDGQKDLGAALEQSKKASISDARKRALRLFGEYLGNSCYDKDHIKDVNANRSLASLAEAPNVILPGQKLHQDQSGAVAVESGQFEVQKTFQVPPQIQQHSNQQAAHQQHQPPQQQHKQVRRPIQQARAPIPQQVNAPQQVQRQAQQWKPPQVLRIPHSAAMQQKQVNSGGSATLSDICTMQTAASIMSVRHGVPAAAMASPYPQHRVNSNAPPPPRLTTHKYSPSSVKSENVVEVQAQSDAQYNMEDLSLSQFDFDPFTEKSNPVKKMRN